MRLPHCCLILCLCLQGSFALLCAVPTDKSGLCFVENRGQLRHCNGQACNRQTFRYSIHTRDCDLHLKPDGVAYVFKQPSGDSVRLYRMDMRFEGANANVTLEAQENLDYQEHYFGGALPPEGVTNVRHFRKIIYHDLYPRIDWVIYVAPDGGGVKHEFVVRPHGNPGRIRMTYNGADSLHCFQNGVMCARNPLGHLLEGAPYAYQDEGLGQRLQIDCVYDVNPNRQRATFNLGAYDRSKTLVIDPYLIWATLVHDAPSLQTGEPDDPYTMFSYYRYQIPAVDAAEIHPGTNPATDPASRHLFTSGTVFKNFRTLLPQAPGTISQVLTSADLTLYINEFAPNGQLLQSLYVISSKPQDANPRDWCPQLDPLPVNDDPITAFHAFKPEGDSYPDCCYEGLTSCCDADGICCHAPARDGQSPIPSDCIGRDQCQSLEEELEHNNNSIRAKYARLSVTDLEILGTKVYVSGYTNLVMPFGTQEGNCTNNKINTDGFVMVWDFSPLLNVPPVCYGAYIDGNQYDAALTLKVKAYPQGGTPYIFVGGATTSDCIGSFPNATQCSNRSLSADNDPSVTNFLILCSAHLRDVLDRARPDGFLAIFKDESGGTLASQLTPVNFMYWGGTQSDFVEDVAFDMNGKLWALGGTKSQVPGGLFAACQTGGPFFTSTGGRDYFLSRFEVALNAGAPSGFNFEYSGFIGGSGDEPALPLAYNRYTDYYFQDVDVCGDNPKPCPDGATPPKLRCTECTQQQINVVQQHRNVYSSLVMDGDYLWIFGNTNSWNICNPTDFGPRSDVLSNSTSDGSAPMDGFIAQVKIDDGHLGDINQCLHFGGTEDDYITAARLGPDGNIWLTGFTQSSNLFSLLNGIQNGVQTGVQRFVSPDPYPNTSYRSYHTENNYDIFLAELRKADGKIKYLTHYGSPGGTCCINKFSACFSCGELPDWVGTGTGTGTPGGGNDGDPAPDPLLPTLLFPPGLAGFVSAGYATCDQKTAILIGSLGPSPIPLQGGGGGIGIGDLGPVKNDCCFVEVDIQSGEFGYPGTRKVRRFSPEIKIEIGQEFAFDLVLNDDVNCYREQTVVGYFQQSPICPTTCMPIFQPSFTEGYPSGFPPNSPYVYHSDPNYPTPAASTRTYFQGPLNMGAFTLHYQHPLLFRLASQCLSGSYLHCPQERINILTEQENTWIHWTDGFCNDDPKIRGRCEVDCEP